MRRSLIILGLLVLFLIPVFVSAGIAQEDKMQIRAKLSILQQAVNNSDLERISGLLFPEISQELEQKIRRSIKGKNIDYYQNIDEFKGVSGGRVKVIGKTSVSGQEGVKSWNYSGFSSYFIFEEVSGEWMLVDSNFAEKLYPGFIFNILEKVFNFLRDFFGLFLLSFILLVFWAWMIIDCAVRPIPAKTKWILLIILIPVIGGIIYFVFPRRLYLKQIKEGSAKTSRKGK